MGQARQTSLISSSFSRTFREIPFWKLWDEVAELAEYLKQFCGGQTDAGADVGASGSGIYDAQLLQLARDLGKVLGRA